MDVFAGAASLFHGWYLFGAQTGKGFKW